MSKTMDSVGDMCMCKIIIIKENVINLSESGLNIGKIEGGKG